MWSERWRCELRSDRAPHRCPSRNSYELADADRERLRTAPGGREGVDATFKQISDEFRKEAAAKVAADAAAEAERVAAEDATAAAMEKKLWRV